MPSLSSDPELAKFDLVAELLYVDHRYVTLLHFCDNEEDFQRNFCVPISFVSHVILRFLSW